MDVDMTEVKLGKDSRGGQGYREINVRDGGKKKKKKTLEG